MYITWCNTPLAYTCIALKYSGQLSCLCTGFLTPLGAHACNPFVDAVGIASLDLFTRNTCSSTMCTIHTIQHGVWREYTVYIRFNNIQELEYNNTCVFIKWEYISAFLVSEQQ